MILDFAADGSVSGIVGSLKDGPLPVDPGSLGSFETNRQGVITEIDGAFYADLFLAGGGVIGPFPDRAACIAGEIAWLLQNRF